LCDNLSDEDYDSIERILVARFDNIGDLVLTTPLIVALHERFNQSVLDIAVHEYTREVLQGVEEIDHIWSYKKSKHCGGALEKIKSLYGKIRLYLLLRGRYDLLCFVGDGTIDRNQKFIRWVGARITLTFGETDLDRRQVCYVNSRSDGTVPAAEEIFDLLEPLNIIGKPPSFRLSINSSIQNNIYHQYENFFNQDNKFCTTVHIHLSARKPSQRWSMENYEELIKQLLVLEYKVLVTWAPGSLEDSKHPGDDEKCQRLISRLFSAKKIEYRLVPIVTTTITELKAALSFSDISICPDGGTMHIVAGLGIPIVALFGDSDSKRWGPWGVPYRILQTPSRNVSDISVSMVRESFINLLEQVNLEVNHDSG